MALKDFGKVWMASSPLTGRFQPIKKAINKGVDTIVLKTATTLEHEGKKKGKRRLIKGGRDDIVGRFTLTAKDGEPSELANSVYSTATHLDIEMLTIEEANKLYQKIKKYAPSVKVVASFGPLTPDDFGRTSDIDADALEINTRWFKMDLTRPYIVMPDIPQDKDFESLEPTGSSFWYGALEKYSPADIIRMCLKEAKKYEMEKVRKYLAFKQGLSEIPRDRPILLKLARQYWEMDMLQYLNMPVDGFTYSDSMKNSLMTSISGIQINIFGKGSISGAALQQETLGVIKILYDHQLNGRYLSASGGILDGASAKICLDKGANSVQICSAVYLEGFERLGEIVKSVNE